MNTLGQLCMLVALVGCGYGGWACVVGWRRDHVGLLRSGVAASLLGVASLTVVVGVLAWALVACDSRLAYAANYSSPGLPWSYRLSALWAGQAGSLLLWAWFLGILALAYRFLPGRAACSIRQPAFGTLMGCLCFLVATMVFGADPMKPSLSEPASPAGLSPLLRHPAMLVHPPIIFLAYAAWTIPFALALVALVAGRLDSSWTREARPWALLAWGTLGGGILLGAEWAYQELGWGGYWSWDPVENGSLIPWLTGTALIHCMMAWRARQALKKTALGLAFATFALCNFAAFLTRSGVFSSVHAFSQSPIGWLFLLFLGAVTGLGVILIILRRGQLGPGQPLAGFWTRESFVSIATVGLLLLAVATTAGTLVAPLSRLFRGRTILVGEAFYNNVLIPTGLVVLAATAMAPLLKWGSSPGSNARRARAVAALLGLGVTVIALALGLRSPIGLAVLFLSVVAVVSMVAGLILGRRQYAAHAIHLGLVLVAIGVTGSSLGSRQHDTTMTAGQTVEWAGRAVRLVGLNQRELPDRIVCEARLEISRGDRPPVTLLPSQHLHLHQGRRETRTTEVAIHSTWRGDFYTIMHGVDDEGGVSLTFIESPLTCWIWLGGWLMAAGTLIGLLKKGTGSEPISASPWRKRPPRRACPLLQHD